MCKIRHLKPLNRKQRNSIITGSNVQQEAVSEIADQPVPFPFRVSLLWHAFLVNGRGVKPTGQRGKEWNPDLFNLQEKRRHGKANAESSQGS